VVSTLSISHPATKNDRIQHMYAWNMHVKDSERAQFAKYVSKKVHHAMLEDGIIPLTDRVRVPPLDGPGVQMDLLAPAPLDDDNIPF